MTTPHPPNGRIGLWGAPSSGKTTFLAALRLAVEASDSELRLFGQDDASTDFLASTTDQLKRQRVFPPATEILPPNLSWTLSRMREIRVPIAGSWNRRLRLTRGHREPHRVYLDLLDAPGGIFSSSGPQEAGPGEPSRLRFADGQDAMSAPRTSDNSEDEERLVSHLAVCDGLLFLFDPTREREMRDAYNYFQRTVLQISQRAVQGRYDHYLPHHLAVCITKFDHPHVYEPAFKMGRVSLASGEYGFPRVAENNAVRLFRELYTDQIGQTVNDLLDGIKNHFHPDRTRYFVTSAVGFYLDPDLRRFRPDDYWNVVQEENGPDRIRGDIHPINVVEPLIWLAEHVSVPGA
jgi:hypothetical protein